MHHSMVRAQHRHIKGGADAEKDHQWLEKAGVKESNEAKVYRTKTWGSGCAKILQRKANM